MRRTRPQAGPALWPAGEDRLSPLVEVHLPHGQSLIQLRLASYRNGSLALELRDSEGRAFAWPTLPCCPTTLAGLLPAHLVGAPVVAIRPSALRSGITDALVAAGLLTDLELEVPIDRHWAPLMRVELEAAWRQAGLPPADAPDPVPARLRRLAVPPGWCPTVRRIQEVFRRRGLEVAELDAMLAWAWASRAIAAPRPLPPSAEAILAQLAPLLEQAADREPDG